MDSWRSVFLANGTDLPSDSFTNTRKFIAGWDQGLSNDLENDIFISQLPDKSFSDLAAKSFGFNAVSIGKVASSCLFPSNLLDEEEEEKEGCSNFSSLASQELPRIDFKLSSLLDYSDSNESDLPAKKPRTAHSANSCSQKPLCQVFGCNMDLTSSKDYHKRHRVCEIHSKTAMVIVSGIQQRFCQQCSRFHLLKEFDDGKRSCRRRLAGHNQRRRKPSFYFLPGRHHKVLHISQGNKCLENSLDKDFSLVFPEAFPSSRLVKFKDESSCSIFSSNGKSSSRIYQWKPVSSSSEDVSSIWDIHEASRSSCALSLLSAKSQQVSGNQNKPPNSPTEYHQIESPLMDSGKSSSSYRKGSSTVDLLQLSLHLQRIEQQRNFTEVKQEYKDLYFP